jgi:hypothetical protein
MQNQIQLTPEKIKQAYIIAIIADAIQLPLFIGLLTGILTLPSEALDITADIGVMLLLSRAIGFHLALVPCFILEVLPGVGLIPTWTASVAFVVAQRKKQLRQQSPIQGHVDSGRAQVPPLCSRPALIAPPVIHTYQSHLDIQDAEIVSEVPATATAWTPPPLPLTQHAADDRAIDGRLERLAQLHTRGLITEQELNTKRQQILSVL